MLHDALINNVHQKSMEIYDLNVSLQEQDLVITALQNDLRKLKGKALVDNVVTSHTIDPEMLKIDVEPLAPKLLNNRTIHSDYLRHAQEKAAILRRMIPEPGDTNHEVPINETFHVQTDDELTEKELKQIKADDQAIQTIILDLPEDIYAAVDSCETAQEIWLRVQQMMKGSDIRIQEKKANNLKFLNNLQPEWSRHVTIVYQTKDLHTADYTQLYDFLKYNQKENYMQQPMPNPEDIIDATTAMNMALTLMAKAFKLNYSTPTKNNQRISSNPHNRQIAQPGMNMGQDRQMQMVGGNGENQFRQYAGQNNTRVQNVGNQNGLIGVPGNANQNENGNLVAAHAKGNATRHNVAADLDEIEEVNANCILMANLQQASTSGTQTDKAPVYDSDGSAEVHNYEDCYDNDIFNMFTQEEQYTELLEPIPESHQVPQNDNNVISKTSFLINKFNLRKRIKELDNILVKTGQSIHMLSPKPDSLYHTKQKMALGYQNPFYLKQAQKKQQSLYDGKVLLEKLDPPIVHDSEETLQLAQESRQKMKQLNKEIKPANYTKINHLSEVFVSQMAKSREELYFLDISKMANVSTSISIPNIEFLDDTTPNVARKFLNEVKSTIVTLQRVVKHRMTLETHNWSSSAHQELPKIVKDENFPIVNQVNTRVQNFEIQFLKEAAKFVGDFKSLAKEADESLAKHKALESEIERLLRAVVSQDIMSVVQKASVVDTSNL
nr:hypothetical protein [Tanacetum cinerariifolium]